MDADGDGYRTSDGSTTSTTDVTCTDDGLADAFAPDTDCDDDAAGVHPGASEITGDGVDGDCDGIEWCYADFDSDGYRTNERVESIDADCEDPGEAAIDVPLIDCDDTRAGVNPEAVEVEGDGIDQDCDGVSPGDPVVVDSGDDEKGGCSSAPNSAPNTAWLALFGLVLLRRRRVA